MRLFIIVVASVLLLVGCTKTSVNKASETDKVYIRIENTTTENFSNFTLNTTEFGGIGSGDTTTYFLCKDVLPIPFSNFIAINNKHIYIVDIVPTPYMKNGNYLMKLVTDSSSLRYQASFIKE